MFCIQRIELEGKQLLQVRLENLKGVDNTSQIQLTGRAGHTVEDTWVFHVQTGDETKVYEETSQGFEQRAFISDSSEKRLTASSTGGDPKEVAG